MAITVKHKFVSAIPDGTDDTIVRPSNWNDDHELTGTIPVENGGTGASTLTGYVKGNGTAAMTASATVPSTDITGLGTMSAQDANNVAITGGSISGVTVGGYVPTTTTITAGTGLTGGGDLSANRTLDIANTTVVAASYGSSSKTLTATVNAQGQLTALADTNIAIANTQVSGLGTASTKDAGAALGVATLDASGKVPVSELPAAVLGALSYQGTWDASTNTPTLTSSVGTKGYYYVVSVAGSTNLNGITDWVVGDWAVFNGTAWQKVDNTDSVTSVNGATGAVVLTTTNIAEGTNLYYTDARARASNSAGTGISYDNTTGVITNAAPDQTVVLTDGTAIDVTGTYPNFTINNTAPDQVVSLTGAGTTSVSGTYPNFTITSNDSKVGDVVGPASATDNAIARYDTTTGKLIQNSLVIVDDAGSVTGVNALTAESLTVNNNATLGSSNTDTLDVRSRISSDLDPETNNAKDIGTSGRNWRDGFFGRTVHTVNLELTGTTSFDGQQGTSGQVLTSAGTGNTPTWTTPTTGTVTSVAATAGTGISVSGSPITSSGTLTITNTAPDQTVVLTAGTGISTSGTYPNFTVTNTAPDQTVAITGAGGAVVTGTYPNFTVTTPSGTVTSVSGTAPIASSGGATPAISISQASGSTDGYLSSTDWTTFNNKSNTTGTVTSVGGTGTVNGISLSGTVTSSGNLTLGGTLSGVSLSTQVTGTLPIANGGTGETTRQAAMDALAGSTTSGQYLRGNGTDVVMSAIQAADVPTLNQNTTGTASNVTGTVAIANGGTGQTTAANAFNALSPLTTLGDILYEETGAVAARLPIGTTGQVLTVSGGKPAWATGGGSPTPASVSDQANTSTGYFDLPAGTTAQRPASPATGMIRFNTTNTEYEVYDGTEWRALTTSIAGGYSVDYLVVAGGGGGWASYGGGGGGGGYIDNVTNVISGTGYTITIGGGGAVAANGSNSSALGSTANGGGRGGQYTSTLANYTGGSGGSGGGGGSPTSGGAGAGGSGTSGQGFAGGSGYHNFGSLASGGGGGGAGGAGTTVPTGGSPGGAGGAGLDWKSLGTTRSAGGTGSTNNSSPGVAGGANSGRGGDGGGTAQAGGSGVVIIRYLGSQRGTGGTVTSTGGYTYHTFTTSGTYTA
jgi:fibronectin-binding autotransporter adhesin